jgi:hypothetical protein
MSFKIQPVSYFNLTVKDEPGEAYNLLSLLAQAGIDLQAFNAIPIGPSSTQLTLFPENEELFLKEAEKNNMKVEGPNRAILVQGDDELGALREVHHRLFDAKVNVYACNGVSDGEGDFGYIIYVRPDAFEKAQKALGL